MIYIFDVDGTVTASDQAMSPEMEGVMLRFMQDRTVYFCSGSAIKKMKEQLPVSIREKSAGLFPTMGNEFWKGSKMVYQKSFKWPQGLEEALNKWLENSKYSKEKRCGDHIQDRETMICFSIVGKNANLDQRADYIDFDKNLQERVDIAKDLKQRFPELLFVIGGQTSIDIATIGSDKSQVLGYLRETTASPITLVGDRTEPGGNDYPLAKALREEGGDNGVIQVHTYADTIIELEKIMSHKCE